MNDSSWRSPFVCAARLVALYPADQSRRAFLLDVAAIVASTAPYLAIRALYWLTGDPETTNYLDSHWAEGQLVPVLRYAIGLWSGFRAGWLIIVAGSALVVRSVGWKTGLVVVATTAASTLGSLVIAKDMSRSLMIVSPALLLSVWLWEEWRRDRMSWVLPVVVAANFALPAMHVMWDQSLPIASLPVELDKDADHPRLSQRHD